MKRLKLLGSLLGAAVVALSVAACGDNSQRCGVGTHEDDGYCTPDGTVTCGQGTILNEATGDCDLDPSACADGTVLVDGECIPEDDALTFDMEEAAEPNDGFQVNDDIAGEFNVPAIGADGVVIHGCITPYRDFDGNGPDIDYDMWNVTVAAPALIEVTADGVHGLDAGWVTVTASEELTELSADGWLRIGANVAGDTSQRQIFLPAPGTYSIVMTDTRSIFFDGNPFNITGAGVGSPETCYYTTVSQVALPTAIALAADTPASGTIEGDVIAYSYNPIDGDVVFLEHDITSDAAAPSVTVMRNSAFFKYGEPAPFFLGVNDADIMTFVVDPVYNYALNPRPYTITANQMNVGALPTDGTVLTHTHETNTPDDTWQTIDEFEWAWFDVGAGEVVHFDIAFGQPVNLAFIDSETFFVGLTLGAEFFFGDPPRSTFNGWVRFPTAGRYYLVTFDPSATAGDTYTITSTVSRVIPDPLVSNVAETAVPFSDLEATWHTFDPADAMIWMGIHTQSADFNVVSTDWYDITNFATGTGGWIDEDILTEFFKDNDASGTPDTGFVVFNDPTNWLIKVWDFEDDLADGTSTYDITVGDRVFTDLGTAVEATPASATDLPIDTDQRHLAFVRATPGFNMHIEVTPDVGTLDLVLQRLNPNESAAATSDVGFDNDPESMDLTVPPSGAVAIAVSDFNQVGGAFDINVTVTPPIPYVDTCNGTNMMPQTPLGPFGALGDDAVTTIQTLPFAFNLFNVPVTTYQISTNGFIAFQTPMTDSYFGNQNIPAASDPDGIIAPVWDDYDTIVICKTETVDTVTIQWNGFLYFTGTPVQFQLVLHDDGFIDFIYGGNQAATGGPQAGTGGGTVGAENLTGSTAMRFGFNQAIIGPNSSRTFTTNSAP